MNLKLKSQLIAHYRIQGAAAKALGLSESRVSRLVNGLNEPTAEERKRFCDALGEDLFPSGDGAQTNQPEARAG